MTKYKVTITNRDNVEYEVDAKRSILDELRNQGVDLPYGCKYGGCITCAAKLTSGDVDQKRQVALNNWQLDNGYVILCVARAKSDITLEIGTESHDKLYRNPFLEPLKSYQLKADIASKEDIKLPEADIDRIYDYDPMYLADILKSVKTIAMVGASGDKTKFSYGVLRQLSEIGYDILPINPNPKITEIRGLKVYRSLQDIDKQIDMVEVFRPATELYGIAEQAIEVGAKVLWGQIGVYDDKAAKLAESAGLKVVMNRCPKIELFRPFWKPRLDLKI